MSGVSIRSPPAHRFSERNRHFAISRCTALISTLKEIIACFPVYRTYVTEHDPVSDHDSRYIAEAGGPRSGGHLVSRRLCSTSRAPATQADARVDP